MFDVLFGGVAVTDFPSSLDWYRRLFGREPDVVAHETEVMWRVADGGWLYVKADADRAGHALVGLAVSDLEETVRALAGRGLEPGPVTPEGDARWKSLLADPDGNSVELIQVAER
jgi:catechol 2,3-dioxygenase-like lactoylglutathione lyase family enzyme